MLLVVYRLFSLIEEGRWDIARLLGLRSRNMNLLQVVNQVDFLVNVPLFEHVSIIICIWTVVNVLGVHDKH